MRSKPSFKTYKYIYFFKESSDAKILLRIDSSRPIIKSPNGIQWWPVKEKQRKLIMNDTLLENKIILDICYNEIIEENK